MSEFEVLREVLLDIWDAFGITRWFIIPALVALVLSEIWLWRVRTQFIKNIKWVTLEFKVPRENLKTPKAMEQFFSALHATYSFGIPFWEKWWKGRLEDWMTLEMVGFAHGVHFYVRCWESNRNLVETALFSHYPDVEINEAEEYKDRFGTDLPNDTYDLFGADLILNSADPYPIKTYPFFEEQVEERRVDPLSTITEVMSNLKDDEMAWIQILIRPTGSDRIKKEAEDIINEITGRKQKESKNPIDALFEGFFHFFKNLIFGGVEYPKWPGGEEEKKAEKTEQPKRLTPGELDILKAIENKVAKLVFETVVRFIYIDSKTSFTTDNVSAIMGGIRYQFTTQHLNAFKPTMETMTIPVFRFPFFRQKSRLLQRKRNIFKNYTTYMFPLWVKLPLLSTEELATIFHPPITAVGAPKLYRLEVRKGEPPGNLPIGE